MASKGTTDTVEKSEQIKSLQERLATDDNYGREDYEQDLERLVTEPSDLSFDNLTASNTEPIFSSGQRELARQVAGEWALLIAGGAGAITYIVTAFAVSFLVGKITKSIFIFLGGSGDGSGLAGLIVGMLSIVVLGLVGLSCMAALSEARGD